MELKSISRSQSPSREQWGSSEMNQLLKTRIGGAKNKETKLETNLGDMEKLLGDTTH